MATIFLLLNAMSALALSPDNSVTPWNVTCPARCTCELRSIQHLDGELRTVDCTDLKLTQIPDNIPHDVQMMILQRNAILSVQEHLPKYTDLRRLDLSYNSIHSLGAHPLFENLTSLQYVNLGHNDLTILEHGSFSGLSGLQELRLSNNRISEIEQHAFGGLNNLEKLALDGNTIGALEKDWFDDMPSLQLLELDNNKVASLGTAIFSSLQHLAKLSLAGNKLKFLDKSAFKGLDKLEHLLLDDNLIHTIPSKALNLFQGLKILSFNGNPVTSIRPGQFSGQLIYQVNMNEMPELVSIEKHAFENMMDLTILQLHDNPHLTYIDPQAFVHLPNLKVVYVHNNALKALPAELLQQAANLEEVSLYNNPLRCDCNAHWVKQVIDLNTTVNYTDVHFAEPGQIMCDSPASVNGHLLKDIDASTLPTSCPPTIIPFFNDSFQAELGQTITYECRAIGVPAPHIHWIMANGKVVNNTSNFSRVRLGMVGSLTILQVKARDAGTYTCVATNTAGYVTTSTRLQVHSKDIHLLHKGVATNFITVTWNGTDSTVFTSDYIILYRESGTDEEYGRIHLRPYMRTYTITNLKPKTTYEFCIAYQHNNEIVKLNCLNIKTKRDMYVMQGIKTVGHTTILLVISSTFIFLFLLCLSISLVRRHLRRKAYKEPEGVNICPPNQRVGTMSQIPLDNLYNPPSTPICTSRTSLINQSSA